MRTASIALKLSFINCQHLLTTIIFVIRLTAHKGEMGNAYGMLESLKGRDRFWDGMIILKWILSRMSGYRLDTNGLWHGLILGFYEHGDEPCVSLRFWIISWQSERILSSQLLLCSVHLVGWSIFWRHSHGYIDIVLNLNKDGVTYFKYVCFVNSSIWYPSAEIIYISTYIMYRVVQNNRLEWNLIVYNN
jgi:hypothetical protein